MQLGLNDRLQSEMRRAHYDGAPGVMTSALVWIAASMVCLLAGTHQGVWVLLVGGAMIHPISTLLTRIWVKPQVPKAANPLNQLAGASTVWLIACCIMAYGLYQLRPELFFPAMMMTIGCRYAVFATMFGLGLYWLLGLVLMVASCVTIFLWVAPGISALIGGLVELAFAWVLFRGAKTFATAN